MEFKNVTQEEQEIEEATEETTGLVVETDIRAGSIDSRWGSIRTPWFSE